MNLSSPARSIPWTGNRVADTILREMEAHRKRLGAQLLELRKTRGWSQEDAAHEVGVGVKTWRLWERAKTLPYDSNIRRLAEVFEVDPDYFGQVRPAPLGLEVEPSDVLADRLDAIEQAIADLRQERADEAAAVRNLLAQQDAVLKRIQASIAREEKATKDAEDATARLLAAVAVASQALRAETPRPAEAPEQQGT